MLNRFFITLITLITCLCLSTSSLALKSNSSKNIKGKKADPVVIDIDDPTKPIVCEPSNTEWAQAPEALPTGAKIAVVEGNPVHPGTFTMRLKLPPNYSIPAHWNTYDEHITVISGALNLGMGDSIDPSKSKSLPEGSYVRIPAKMHHFAWTGDEETIIQLHGMGPWGLFYVDSGMKNSEQSMQPNDYDEPLTKNE